MKRVDWSTVTSLGLALPEVVESTSYGTPALKVRGKLFTRLLDNREDIVVRVDAEERAALVDAAPETFEVTPHYQNHPWVVVHLAAITRGLLGEILAEAWRKVAPGALLADGWVSGAVADLPSKKKRSRAQPAPRKKATSSARRRR